MLLRSSLLIEEQSFKPVLQTLYCYHYERHHSLVVTGTNNIISREWTDSHATQIRVHHTVTTESIRIDSVKAMEY